jgi:RNA polymerase sigma-70 factor (ECF subfamily)
MGLEAEVIVSTLLGHRLRLIAAAVSVVRNSHDADDVFQRVVLTALKSADHFTDPPHLLAWAIRTTRHRALDVARQKKLCVLSDDVLDRLEAEWGDPSSPARSDVAEALNRCLSDLSPAAERVVRLRYFDGLGVPAIAARVRRTSDAVYQVLSRTHRTLRACVEQRLAVARPPEVVS